MYVCVCVCAHRPVGDDRWYTRPHTPGSPLPLRDLGECTADSGTPTCTKVTPPTLSPSLETIRSGEDLYDRWRRLMRNHPKTISSVGGKWEGDKGKGSNQLHSNTNDEL